MELKEPLSLNFFNDQDSQQITYSFDPDERISAALHYMRNTQLNDHSTKHRNKKIIKHFIILFSKFIFQKRSKSTRHFNSREKRNKGLRYSDKYNQGFYHT